MMEGQIPLLSNSKAFRVLNRLRQASFQCLKQGGQQFTEFQRRGGFAASGYPRSRHRTRVASAVGKTTSLSARMRSLVAAPTKMSPRRGGSSSLDRNSDRRFAPQAGIRTLEQLGCELLCYGNSKGMPERQGRPAEARHFGSCFRQRERQCPRRHQKGMSNYE